MVAPYLKTPTDLLKAEFSFMVHLTAGYFEQQVGGEIKKVRAGSILLAGHGQITSLKHISSDIAGFFILFENSTLNELLHNKQLLKVFVINPLIALPEPDSQWVHAVSGLLHREVSGPAPDPHVYIPLFGVILHKVLAAAQREKGFSKPYEVAVKFRELAHQHYAREKRLSFYARSIGVSENYLNRCVKQVLDKAAKEVLVEITMLQTQLLLRDFTRSISEVAYAVNFDDPSYFGRLFKKITGLTPTEYRQRIRHDSSGTSPDKSA
jgi:AraC-like DNA-binding protein